MKQRMSLSMEMRLLRKIVVQRKAGKQPRLDWFGEVQQEALRAMNHHSFLIIKPDGKVVATPKGRAVLNRFLPGA